MAPQVSQMAVDVRRSRLQGGDFCMGPGLLSQCVCVLSMCVCVPIVCLQMLLSDFIENEEWLSQRRKLLRLRAGISENEKRKVQPFDGGHWTFHKKHVLGMHGTCTLNHT